MLLEIHMIQNHAPSNLNRDDTGSPKECLFGGALRARISSQCLKRSVRKSVLFEEELREHLGIRTKALPREIKQKLIGLGCSEGDAQLVAERVSRFGRSRPQEQQPDTGEGE